MAEEFLHGGDVVAVFEQVSGEASAEGVAGGALVDPRQLGCFPDGLLQTTLVYVVAAHDATARVHRQPPRRKDLLPDPLLVGVGVLAFQGVGQIDRAVAFGQILLMQALDAPQMVL